MVENQIGNFEIDFLCLSKIFCGPNSSVFLENLLFASVSLLYICSFSKLFIKDLSDMIPEKHLMTVQLFD